MLECVVTGKLYYSQQHGLTQYNNWLVNFAVKDLYIYKLVYWMSLRIHVSLRSSMYWRLIRREIKWLKFLRHLVHRNIWYFVQRREDVNNLIMTLIPLGTKVCLSMEIKLKRREIIQLHVLEMEELNVLSLLMWHKEV